MTQVDKALAFAVGKHGNQKYGKFPYSIHLQDVMDTCRTMQLSENYLVVAALHDVLEDTETLKEEIFYLFGEKIANAVEAITKTDKESYREYIIRLSKNNLAKNVKICDLLNNLECSVEDSNYNKLISKYEKGLFWIATL